MNPTQEEIIEKHLKEHKTITSWEAITRYRITRISALIYNLRQRGFDITTENKMNGKKHYGFYTLITDKQIRLAVNQEPLLGTQNEH
jgi:hypothetical protein